MNDSSPAPRRWPPRFSLRTLLVVVSLLAVALAGFAHWCQGKRRQWLAADTLMDHGCSIGYVDGRPLALRSRQVQLLGLVVPEYCLQTVIWIDFPPKVTDQELVLLKDLPYLKTLHLDHAPHITVAGLAPLSGLSQLEILYLKETQVGDAGLLPIRQHRNLKEIWIANSDVSAASLPWIASNRRLTHLDLRGARLADESLAPLGGLEHLEVLSLADTTITSRGLTAISRLPQLAHLYLPRTKIDDVGLALLESLPKLQTLDIRGTPTTAASRQRFKQARPSCRLDE